MRRYKLRLIVGGLLLFGGLLGLLDAMGIIENSGSIFWGVIWGAAAAFFLALLVNGKRNWWAAFPGFTFLGLAIASFLPGTLHNLDGLFFFAGISMAFWWVYFTDTNQWWAIIPGGVLLTLGVVSALDEIMRLDTGGIFFIGLGITFLFVAILPGGNNRKWAYIPAVILLIFGTLLTQSMTLAAYVGPALLIIFGGYLVVGFFRKK